MAQEKEIKIQFENRGGRRYRVQATENAETAASSTNTKVLNEQKSKKSPEDSGEGTKA